MKNFPIAVLLCIWLASIGYTNYIRIKAENELREEIVKLREDVRLLADDPVKIQALIDLQKQVIDTDAKHSDRSHVRIK